MDSDEDRSPEPGDAGSQQTRDSARNPERDPARDPAHAPAREPDASPGLEELLGVLLHESTLWPLLIVIVLSFGSLGAGLIVLSVVDRNLFAAGALILMLGMTLDLLWRSRRRTGLRPLARGVALLWLAALALAGLAVWLGIA